VKRRSSIMSFLLLTFAWSWLWLGAAWIVPGETPTLLLRLLAGIGPILVAAVLVNRHPSPIERSRFWHRMIEWPADGWKWLIVIAALAAGPALVSWFIADGTDRTLAVDNVASVTGILVFAVAASLAEEPGWRGYALDNLLRRNSRLSASLVIGLAWAAWHLPLYGIEGTFQHDEVGFATTLFWLFTVGFFAQSVLMTWIYGRTSGSILAAVAFHALINVSGEVFELSTAAQALRLGLWLGLAAVVVVSWWSGELRLGSQPVSQPTAETANPPAGSPSLTERTTL
jgi:membrane protease YdiL (CAAX protease family)